MATQTPTAHAHSASSPQTEERLRARYLDFRFEPNLRLDSLVTAEGNQVRLIDHRAPAAMVTRYGEQMKAGAVFPAIVVNDGNEIIDGNTRWHAAIKAGKQTIAAYICTGLTALQARSLSIELNQCHGLSMTEEELHAFVVGAVRDGQALDAKVFARMTGIRATTLTRWIAQATFEKRARAFGLPERHVAVLSEGCQAALNPVRLIPVLRDLTALAAEAKMSASDLRPVVARVNGAASEADALSIVAAERDGRRDQIRSLANGFSAGRRRGGRATMHIAALLKLQTHDLMDVSPDKRGEMLDRLQTLRDRIDQVITDARAPGDPQIPNPPDNAEPALSLAGQGALNA